MVFVNATNKKLSFHQNNNILHIEFNILVELMLYIMLVEKFLILFKSTASLFNR